MQRLAREAPLPREMQGRWVAADEPLSELVVNGGAITCFGRAVDYDYKEVGVVDGALTVSLGIDDEASEDTFQRSNITALVITPEGEFYGYNVKWVTQFVRPNAG